MRSRNRWIGLFLLGGMLGGGFVAALLGNRASTVDWTRARAVVFESDDWGLCGFLPDHATLVAFGTAMPQNSRYPPVYGGSTLEDSTAVADLCGVLAAHHGRDGMPAVLQPNYIVAALACEPLAGAEQYSGRLLARLDQQNGWFRYELPYLPRLYARRGLLPSMRAGIQSGVWYPEFHGSYHYDPQRRRDAVAADSIAREAACRGVLPFPGDSKAWELGPWRDSADLMQELDAALAVFAGLFARRPASVIAPDYTWGDRCERMWSRRGLTVIQAKREQRHPRYAGGRPLARARKLVARTGDRLRHRGRVYLERNCRLEPVQTLDTGAVVADCLWQIRKAWRSGEPAVVETHRINYVHLDEAVRRDGLGALASVLASLQQGTEGLPLYLTDNELAQLDRRGTSWCVRGPRIVVRNLSRSRRVIVIPRAAFDLAGAPREADIAAGPVLVAIPPGQSHVLGPW